MPSETTARLGISGSGAPDEAPAHRMPAGVPLALRDGPYDAVRAAWEAAHRAWEVEHPPLRAALERLAGVARRAQVPVAAVLCTLDAVARPEGGRRLDWPRLRQWAGRVVIGAYYRDD
jgi:hypothetical protein